MPLLEGKMLLAVLIWAFALRMERSGPFRQAVSRYGERTLAFARWALRPVGILALWMLEGYVLLFRATRDGLVDLVGTACRGVRDGLAELAETLRHAVGAAATMFAPQEQRVTRPWDPEFDGPEGKKKKLKHAR